MYSINEIKKINSLNELPINESEKVIIKSALNMFILESKKNVKECKKFASSKDMEIIKVLETNIKDIEDFKTELGNEIPKNRGLLVCFSLEELKNKLDKIDLYKIDKSLKRTLKSYEYYKNVCDLKQKCDYFGKILTF